MRHSVYLNDTKPLEGKSKPLPKELPKPFEGPKLLQREEIGSSHIASSSSVSQI